MRPAPILPFPAPNHRRRNRLVESHLGLVGPIARQIHGRLPSCFDLADLVSAGTLGLIAAAERSNCSRARDPEAMFTVFARQRIRGAILDSIRRRRSVEATHQPLSAAAKETVEPAGPRVIERAETARYIWQAFRSLDDTEARLVHSRYWAGLTISEAAAEMGISPSTASRIHQAALAKMRTRLAGRAA